jgi:hypothetical protein
VIRDLVLGSQLVAIDTVHFTAQRLDPAPGKPLPTIDLTSCDVVTEFETFKPNGQQLEAASFLVRGALRYVPKGGGETLATIEIALRVHYTFASRAEQLTDASLALFANQVALHHAWPFMRERVAAACQIIGIPPYVLPLRKLVG